MMIVLDCNAALEMSRETEAGKAIRSLLLEGERVIAPSTIIGELANATSKYVRGGYLDEEVALQMHERACVIIDELMPVEALQTEALREAIRLNHSAYDLFYLVLARRTGATVVTLDQALQKLCLNNGVNCLYTDTKF